MLSSNMIHGTVRHTCKSLIGIFLLPFAINSVGFIRSEVTQFHYVVVLTPLSTFLRRSEYFSFTA